MNKIFKIFSIISLTLIMFTAVIVPAGAEEYNEDGYYSKTSEQYLSATPAVRSMLEMQNRITDTLSKENGKYVYDYDLIKEIVYEFNFTDINKELNKEWSQETFFNEVITNIENTTFSTRKKRYSCGSNVVDGGWNFRRTYRDKGRTNEAIKEFSALATSDDIVSQITEVAGNISIPFYPAAGAFFTGVSWFYGLHGTYVGDLAYALNNHNYNSCGTVTTINVWTGSNNVYNQTVY